MTDSIKDLNNKVQKLLEKYYIEDNKEQLYEFADLVPEDTGLTVVVWIDGRRKMKHGKRIKFQNNNSNRLNGGEIIPITISDDPQIPKSVTTKLKISNKDLNKIKSWIKLNKEVLLDYSNGLITTKQLYNKILPLND